LYGATEDLDDEDAEEYYVVSLEATGLLSNLSGSTLGTPVATIGYTPREWFSSEIFYIEYDYDYVLFDEVDEKDEYSGMKDFVEL